MEDVPEHLTAARAARRATGAALLLLGLLTVFRLAYAASAGMTNDETYYWQWSRRLAPAYFDQGPGIAFCIRLGTALFGHTPFGVRFVSVLLSSGTGWLLFLVVRRWFGPPVALWTLVLLNAAPLFNVGSLIAGYDGPQVFFWACALYALTRTLQENRAWGWYAVGLCVGLSALCKLTGLLFAPCVLVFLLLSPGHRRWLATPHPYLGFAVALLVWSPVLVWNARHDWFNFRHGAALGSRSRGAPPLKWFGDFVGSQALVLGPFLFLAELAALGGLVARLRRGTAGESERFIFSFAAPILLLCLLVSLRSKMEANWPAPTHLCGLVAAALWFHGLWAARRKARWAVAGAATFSALAALLILFPVLLTLTGARVSADLAQKANETYGWRPLMREVQAVRGRLEAEGRPVFLAGINYRVPSLLAFYLPGQPETHELFLHARRDQYWLWTRPETLVGQNALVCLDGDKREAVALLPRYFAEVEPPHVIEVRRPGFDGPVKRWQVYVCRGFVGYDPAAHVEGY